MAVCDDAVDGETAPCLCLYYRPKNTSHINNTQGTTTQATPVCGLMDGNRDDRWESEPQQHDLRLTSSTSRRSISSMGSDGSSSLPAIAGASHGVVPTPPPVAFKSKLKPPSQRVTLLPGKAATPASQPSPLKLPSLVKPSAPVVVKPVGAGNQESDDEAPVRDSGGSSRLLLSGGPRGSAVDKHRDFIKELEEQKRKEKEKQSKEEARRRKMQKKLTEKILQEAAMARQKQSEELEPEQCEPQKEDADDPPQDDVAQNEEDEEAKRQQEKEAKRQRKRLLKKQQALLEQLQAKKREKQEEEELGRERDKKRQNKLKKAVLDAIHASKVEEEEEEGEEEELHPQQDEAVEPEQIDDIVQESGVAGYNLEPAVVKGSAAEIETATRKSESESNQSSVSSVLREKKHKKHKTKLATKKVEQDSESEGVEEAIPAVGKGIAAVRQRKDREKHREGASTTTGVTTEDTGNMEEKQRAKDQREAVHKKQHEYLQKLADQRRLKQKGEEDAKLLQEKRRRRVQQEAQQRLQEAAAKQQQQRLQEEQDESQHEEEEKKVVVDVDAMVARLSKLKDKDAMVVPEARDFASWKKRHGVANSQKVFSMTGWYPVIREELEKRGWFYNPEKGSPYFDLKWSLKSDDLKGIKLKEDQYVNHFFQNTSITTKVGLLHNLRSLSWHQSVDIDTVFPRAYDLNEPRDMDAFVMDFRYTFAEGVLKQVVRGIVRADKRSVRLNEAFVYVLRSIARKKLRSKREFASGRTEDSLEESVDDLLSPGAEEIVSDLEWEVLSKCQVDAPGKLRASLTYRKRVFADDRDSNVLPGDVSGPPPTSAPVVDTVLSALEKKQQKQLDKLQAEAFQREKQRLSELLARVSVVSSAACDELLSLTRGLEAACPQFHLNGGGDLSASATDQSRNVWIVKPAGLSRGRGIRVFNQLDALLEYADVVNHKECQWVAQKYIENPLLIAKRKFDIRQWVLVTNWDPLTVWFYEDFYLRLSSEEYSMEDLSDQYVHLTNNSIQKYSDKFSNVYATENGELEIEGNMLHSEPFRQYIHQALGVDEAAFEATLHSRMKEIVVQSLQCVQDMVQHRKNGCELYGYDFMLDETLRPWLIEVNSSPACDYSTPTAKRYVETGLQGIVQVIVDHREYEMRKKNGGGGDSEPDTGRWKRIHKAEYVGKPVSSFGADFQIKGTKVQKSRKGTKRMAAVAEETKVVVESETEVEDRVEEEEEREGDTQATTQGEETDDRGDAACGEAEEEEEEASKDAEDVVASIDSLL